MTTVRLTTKQTELVIPTAAASWRRSGEPALSEVGGDLHFPAPPRCDWPRNKPNLSSRTQPLLAAESRDPYPHKRLRLKAKSHNHW